jgi:hypothetical protein
MLVCPRRDYRSLGTKSKHFFGERLHKSTPYRCLPPRRNRALPLGSDLQLDSLWPGRVGCWHLPMLEATYMLELTDSRKPAVVNSSLYSRGKFLFVSRKARIFLKLNATTRFRLT